MADNTTKTDGAYKAGDGDYVFDVAALKGLPAGRVMRRPSARSLRAN